MRQDCGDNEELAGRFEEEPDVVGCDVPDDHRGDGGGGADDDDEAAAGLSGAAGEGHDVTAGWA